MKTKERLIENRKQALRFCVWFLAYFICGAIALTVGVIFYVMIYAMFMME